MLTTNKKKLKNKCVYLCAIGSNYTSQPYTNKLINVLKDLNVNPTYLYWKRDHKELTVQDNKVITKEILFFLSNSKAKLFFGYILWMIRLFIFSLKNGKKNDVFFVSRLDAGFPIFLASFIKNYRYVYLDRDAAFLSYKLPKIFSLVLKYIESCIGKKSLYHLIPGHSRNFTKKNNVRIIPNSPSLTELKIAKNLKNKIIQNDDRFTIYINGWLKKSRGIPFIFESIQKLSTKKFRILVAGELGCAEAELLVKMENVNYLGVLSNAEALSIYYQSDIVLSFYDPSIPINTVAEPNKWLDCVCTQTQFITNHGILTADIYVKAGIGILVKYGDVNELVFILENLAINKHSVPKTINADLLSQPWDLAMRDLIEPIVRESQIG